MKKIAIIGSGISGLSAAWALRSVANVTVFEREPRIGGHAHTVDVSFGDESVPVDVGFIVCNPLNYPNFMAFMQALKVETVQSDMSFAVSDPEGFEWSSNPQGLFAKKRNVLRLDYIRFLLDILRFNKTARRDIEADCIDQDLTLGQYLDQLKMNETFRKNYILPMGAAIWSTPEADMDAYPAHSFLDFFNNHKLLHTDRPSWRTVARGSRSYVSALARSLDGCIRLSTEVLSIHRAENGTSVRHNHGTDIFDDVILACNAPISRKLLSDNFPGLEDVLSGVQTTANRAVLHSDPALMPSRKSAWASWNVLKGRGNKVTLTYWMNKLQNIALDRPLFVTLNPETPPAPSLTHGEFDFEHPLFNLAGKMAVERLESLNGQDGIWLAGAWLGHGFHEDGLKSGLRVALALGGTVPWTPVNIPALPIQKASTSNWQTESQLVAAQ